MIDSPFFIYRFQKAKQALAVVLGARTENLIRRSLCMFAVNGTFPGAALNASSPVCRTVMKATAEIPTKSDGSSFNALATLRATARI